MRLNQELGTDLFTFTLRMTKSSAMRASEDLRTIVDSNGIPLRKIRSIGSQSSL